ncbi:hypothetical protein DL93DRAFT_2174080 [Clavulina sp. PMI_390]|nr:hypothetical protein DL93DRAFT_2174080 [Clavulina sp. PMI_390]
MKAAVRTFVRYLATISFPTVHFRLFAPHLSSIRSTSPLISLLHMDPSSSSSIPHVRSSAHDIPRLMHRSVLSTPVVHLAVRSTTAPSSDSLPGRIASTLSTLTCSPQPPAPSSTPYEAKIPRVGCDDRRGTVPPSASLNTHVKKITMHGSLHSSPRFTSMAEGVAREQTDHSLTTQPWFPPLKIANTFSHGFLAARVSASTPPMALLTQTPSSTDLSIPYPSPAPDSRPQAILQASDRHPEATRPPHETTAQLDNLPTVGSVDPADAVWPGILPDPCWAFHGPSSSFPHHERMAPIYGRSQPTSNSHHGRPAPDRTKRLVITKHPPSFPFHLVAPLPNQSYRPSPLPNPQSALHVANISLATSSVNPTVDRHNSQINTTTIGNPSFYHSPSDHDTEPQPGEPVSLFYGQSEPHTSTISSETEVPLQTAQYATTPYSGYPQHTRRPPPPLISHKALSSSANPRSYNGPHGNPTIHFSPHSASRASRTGYQIRNTVTAAIPPSYHRLTQHGVSTSAFNRAPGGAICQVPQMCDAVATVPLSHLNPRVRSKAGVTIQDRSDIPIQPLHSSGTLQPMMKTSLNRATNAPYQVTCETQVISQYHGLDRDASQNLPQREIMDWLDAGELNSIAFFPYPFHIYNDPSANNTTALSPVPVTDASSWNRSAPPDQNPPHSRLAPDTSRCPIHKESSRAGPSQQWRPGPFTNESNTLQISQLPLSGKSNLNKPNTTTSPTLLPRSPRRALTISDDPTDGVCAKKPRFLPSNSVRLPPSGSSGTVLAAQNDIIPRARAGASGNVARNVLSNRMSEAGAKRVEIWD